MPTRSQARRVSKCSRKEKRILPKTQIQVPPVSKQQALASRLTYYIPRLAPHNAWLQYLPARLGHSAAVDSATLALVRSLNFYFGGQTDAAIGAAALRDYGKSLALVRSAMDSTATSQSDQLVIAISLIVIFELLMRDFTCASQRNVYSHWVALNAILQTKIASHQVSHVVRALLFNLGGVTFAVPVAQRKPSIFDNENWDSSILENGSTTSEKHIKLNRASQTIRVLRPRLVSYIGRLSAAEDKDEVITATAEVARRMYDAQAVLAETDLLHCLNVTQTKGASNRLITPYSFRFQNSDQLMALVKYWWARCAAISACLHINEICGLSPLPFDEKQLKEEMERCLMNLIMSWEHATAVGPFATCCVAKGFISAWRDLKKVNEWRGIDASKLRAWILPKAQHPLLEWLPRESTEHDIDLAADVVAGKFTKEFRQRINMRNP